MFVQTNGDNKAGTQKQISPDNVLVYITPLRNVTKKQPQRRRQKLPKKAVEIVICHIVTSHEKQTKNHQHVGWNSNETCYWRMKRTGGERRPLGDIAKPQRHNSQPRRFPAQIQGQWGVKPHAGGFFVGYRYTFPVNDCYVKYANVYSVLAACILILWIAIQVKMRRDWLKMSCFIHWSNPKVLRAAEIQTLCSRSFFKRFFVVAILNSFFRKGKHIGL